MARLIWGPELGPISIEDPAGGGGDATNPAKGDPKVTFGGPEMVQAVDATGQPMTDAAGQKLMVKTGAMILTIDPYDPATTNPLAALHVILVPDGASTPATPEIAVMAPYPRSRLDVTGHVDGSPVVVPRPDTMAKNQKYTGKTVLEFAS